MDATTAETLGTKLAGLDLTDEERALLVDLVGDEVVGYASTGPGSIVIGHLMGGGAVPPSTKPLGGDDIGWVKAPGTKPLGGDDNGSF